MTDTHSIADIEADPFAQLLCRLAAQEIVLSKLIKLMIKTSPPEVGKAIVEMVMKEGGAPLAERADDSSGDRLQRGLAAYTMACMVQILDDAVSGPRFTASDLERMRAATAAKN